MPSLFFTNSKPCVGSLIRRVERQHDIFFGDAKRNQVIGNSFFSTIMLNPELAIFDIDMDKTPLHALPLAPPDSRKQIMITHRIKKELSFEVSIRGFQLAIPLQDLLHMPTIVI